MNNKKTLLIIISILLLTIGVSFASWIITLNQTNNNLISSKCFNVTLSEENPINLNDAYPISDAEGRELTPFTFTITNTCNSNASYQVNLEILNTTTLASTEVKVMLDNGTPALLSSKTVTTKTLDNAITAYILKTGYLDPNESVTYNLRLWIDELSTTEMSANKTFSSKLTVTAGYKDSVTNIERCEAEYGEGAAVCNIIAEAAPSNSKCLHTDQNGRITDYNATMSDTDTPIVCSMEDDYGESYYLRGLHTNNNVKFADSCWKIIRTTGTGGIKMIYNGDVDANGKCTTTSGNHTGFTGQTLSLSGNKLYGTSYTKEGSTYTLSDTTTLNWPNDASSIIGKYTCGNTNTSCANPYYVVSKGNDITGYVLKMGVSTNYAQIGTSAFNPSYNSPSYVGYMYNDVYASQSKTMTTSTTILSSQLSSGTNFYYGDTISYSYGYYYITNQDGSNVTQLSWADNYTSLPGKYTCRGTSTYDATTIICSTAYKVLDTTTRANYMIAEYLSGGRTSVGTIKLSNGYTDNGDGTYTLNNQVTEKSAMEWYNGYSSFNNYYVCEDYNQTTCNKLYKITSASQTSIRGEIGVFNNYYYGESFTYNEGTYTLNNTVQFWDINDSTNKTSLNTHHYTCFKASDNTCSEMYYIYYLSGTDPYYIKLNGNETGPEALNKMVNNNDINVKDSTIKKFIDGWYAMNLKGTEYESKLEDTVFCNDRTIDEIGGWSETGTLGTLKFNAYNSKYYLKCPNKRDAFTVSDAEKGNGALTYPVGLLTTAEQSLIGNYTANKTGDYYWASAPGCFSNSGASGRYVLTTGAWHYGGVNTIGGARPAVSLKPGTTFKTDTDGSAGNPYEVDMTS